MSHLQTIMQNYSPEGLAFRAANGFPIGYLPDLQAIAASVDQLEADIIRRVNGIVARHGQLLTASERERMLAHAMNLHAQHWSASLAAAAAAVDNDEEGDVDADLMAAMNNNNEEEDDDIIGLEEMEDIDGVEVEDELDAAKYRVRDVIVFGHLTPESLDPDDRFLVDHRKKYPLVYCADVVYAVYKLCDEAVYEASQLCTAYKRIIQGYELVPADDYEHDDAEEWIHNGTLLMSLASEEDIGILKIGTQAQLEESLLHVILDNEISVKDRMFICANAIYMLTSQMDGKLIQHWRVAETNESDWLRNAILPHQEHLQLTMHGSPVDNGVFVHPSTCVDFIIRGGFVSLMTPFLNMYLESSDMRSYMHKLAFEHDEEFDPTDKDPDVVNVYGMFWQPYMCVINVVESAFELDNEFVTSAHLDTVRAFFAHRIIKRELSTPLDINTRYVRTLLRISHMYDDGNQITAIAKSFFGTVAEPNHSKVLSMWKRPIIAAFIQLRCKKWRNANLPIGHVGRHTAIRRLCGADPIPRQPGNIRAHVNQWMNIKRLIRVDATGGDPLDFVPTAERLEKIRLHALNAYDADVLTRIRRVKQSRLVLVNSMAVVTDAFRQVHVAVPSQLALDSNDRLTWTADGQIAFTPRQPPRAALPDGVIGIIHSMVAKGTPTHWQPLTEHELHRAIVRMSTILPPLATRVTGSQSARIKRAAFSILTNVRLTPRLFAGVKFTGLSSDGSSSSQPPQPPRDSIISVLLAITDTATANFKADVTRDMFASLLRSSDLASATKQYTAVEKRSRDDDDNKEQANQRMRS